MESFSVDKFPAHVDLVSHLRNEVFPHEWHDINTPEHFWFQWRFKALYNQLKDLRVEINQPLKVLDIGCGTGILRDQVEAVTGWCVDGTDLSINALTRAHGGRGMLYYYDILEERDPFINAYEVIILFDIIEHIVDTKAFLKAALRHLKKEGLVLINVPALPKLLSTYDEAVGHLRRYTKETLIVEFEKLQVEIIETRYWGLSLILLLLFRKWMLNRESYRAKVIKKGMSKPNLLLHFLLKIVMECETTLFRKPPVGSSLLLIAKKTCG